MNLQAVKQRFGIIGSSRMLDNALGIGVRVANTDLTVLISGESGVGKEVFSRIIHSLSARKHNKFIAINCGAIPEGTINSELFGHEKGAFTGASSERKGYFETVDGGTIFLDEIGEMPLDTQSYLLRMLESGEFIRVGSSQVQKTDVRVIAATNVDLMTRVQSGKFRDDLYYRLNTVPIKVPALRERPEDIHMLFRKFAMDFADKYRTSTVRLDERAQLLLENYRWPGNIRELKNIAEQLSVLSENKLISAEDLLKLIPDISRRNLPAIRAQNGSQGDLQEREILYKLLFEMKSDLNDLKSLVFNLINTNDLEVPDANSMKQLQPSKLAINRDQYNISDLSDYQESESIDKVLTDDDNKPIIIERNNPEHSYNNSEVVEENLSLEEMEKEMIRKALTKHHGRRKDAAIELGISERTLYRKIKGYDL